MMNTTRRIARLAAFVCLPALSLGLAAPSAWSKDLNRVAISVGSLGNPYFLSIVRGATEAAKKINPNVQVTPVSSEYDLGRQSSEIDSFISSGTDLILIAAADPNAIESAIKRAKAAGIVVIAVDVRAKGADATVQTDNEAAGKLACAWLASNVKTGDVIIQNGPQVSSIVERVKGCKESLAANPALKIISENQDGKVTREGGLNVMQGDLTRFAKIDGVFTVDDPQAVGAALAAKQLNRTDFPIVSVDGAPDAVKAMKAGGQIKATASQDPAREGSLGVEIGYGLMNGKKPEQDMVLIKPELVTQENVGSYKGW